MPSDTHISRRTALATGSAIALGGVALIAWPDTASADITIDWTVSDATFEADADPHVDATIEYQYSVNDPVDHLYFALTVDGEIIAENTLSTNSDDLAADTDLSGRIADASAYDQADFVGPAEHELTIGVDFAVRREDDSAIIEASDSDTATVTVTDNGDIAVGGSAEIVDGGG